jgi:rubrerythrin
MQHAHVIIHPSGVKEDADLIKGGLYAKRRGGPVILFASIEEAIRSRCIVIDMESMTCIRCGTETKTVDGNQFCPTCNHVVVAIKKTYM